ncbi:MAG: OmpH family outer membrane protein [Betaproteobacteria bacterium]|nr:OmpH family outer membrane protein [Betaproteobacteria bacterium]
MKILPSVIAIVLMMVATHVAAQGFKIGYVNGFRLEKESPLAAPEIEQMKKEFAPREQQLQGELEKGAPTMNPAEKQAKEKRLAALAQQFEKLQRSVGEDLEVRKNEARARFLAETNAIIKAIAEAGNYDLILEQAVYSNAELDITDQVLKEMAKRAASAAGHGK